MKRMFRLPKPWALGALEPGTQLGEPSVPSHSQVWELTARLPQTWCPRRPGLCHTLPAGLSPIPVYPVTAHITTWGAGVHLYTLLTWGIILRLHARLTDHISSPLGGLKWQAGMAGTLCPGSALLPASSSLPRASMAWRSQPAKAAALCVRDQPASAPLAAAPHTLETLPRCLSWHPITHSRWQRLEGWEEVSI